MDKNNESSTRIHVNDLVQTKLLEALSLITEIRSDFAEWRAKSKEIKMRTSCSMKSLKENRRAKQQSEMLNTQKFVPAKNIEVVAAFQVPNDSFEDERNLGIRVDKVVEFLQEEKRDVDVGTECASAAEIEEEENGEVFLDISHQPTTIEENVLITDADLIGLKTGRIIPVESNIVVVENKELIQRIQNIVAVVVETKSDVEPAILSMTAMTTITPHALLGGAHVYDLAQFNMTKTPAMKEVVESGNARTRFSPIAIIKESGILDEIVASHLVADLELELVEVQKEKNKHISTMTVVNAVFANAVNAPGAADVGHLVTGNPKFGCQTLCGFSHIKTCQIVFDPGINKNLRNFLDVGWLNDFYRKAYEDTVSSTSASIGTTSSQSEWMLSNIKWSMQRLDLEAKALYKHGNLTVILHNVSKTLSIYSKRHKDIASECEITIADELSKTNSVSLWNEHVIGVDRAKKLELMSSNDDRKMRQIGQVETWFQLYETYNIASLVLIKIFIALLFKHYSPIGDQRQVLFSWKEILSGTLDALYSWNPPDSSLCTWFLVSINSKLQVTRIGISSMDLQIAKIERPFLDFCKLEMEVVVAKTRLQEATSITEFYFPGYQFLIYSAKTHICTTKSHELIKDLIFEWTIEIREGKRDIPDFECIRINEMLEPKTMKTKLLSNLEDKVALEGVGNAASQTEPVSKFHSIEGTIEIKELEESKKAGLKIQVELLKLQTELSPICNMQDMLYTLMKL